MILRLDDAMELEPAEIAKPSRGKFARSSKAGRPARVWFHRNNKHYDTRLIPDKCRMVRS